MLSRRGAPRRARAGRGRHRTQPDRDAVQWEQRILDDGSRWDVYKRYFEPQRLLEELGGGEILLANRWFVMVRA